MATRIILIAAVLSGLVLIDPSWIVVEWSVDWFTSSRPEDATAALIRLAAIGLTGSQLAALSIVTIAGQLGSGSLERLARRALLPILRNAAPIVLVAGSALPAAASEVRLPLSPPPTDRTVETEVARSHLEPSFIVVQAGDSMWTIAADNTDGDVGDYWRRVVDVNRDRFADVNLIHPGDEVILPRA
ncbi:MAG: hypothetical protein WD532_06895 [Acidimicrobiia bacterium]